MVDIVHRIGIQASPAEVYEALATVRGLAGWWTTATSGDADEGGLVTFRFHDPDGAEVGRFAMRVAELVPDRHVRWRVEDGPAEWVGTEVSFALAQQDAWTIVRFAHRDWREEVEFTAHCSMKWATFLLSLRELVETGVGRPSPNDLKIDDWN